MKHSAKAFVVLATGLLFCGRVGAASSELANSGFGEIPARNLFGLRPLELPKVEEKPAPPVPKLTLTGITTFQGVRRALLKAAIPAKAGEPPREESYILSEGQRSGEIEVMVINETASTVLVNNFGTQVTLTFEQAPPSPPPAQGPQTGNPANAAASGAKQPPSRPALRGLPMRPARLPGMPGSPPNPTPTAES